MIVGKREDFSYAEALKKARSKISLDDLRIEHTKVRKVANGGMLIEVLGPDGPSKANALTEQLRAVLQDKVKITRPVAKREIRLVGLDESVSSNEVTRAIVKYGECVEADVKVGYIRPMNNGLFSVWARCPLGAAIKLANLKKISIG